MRFSLIAVSMSLIMFVSSLALTESGKQQLAL